MNNHGHTMVEVMISTAILTVVSLLGFIVLQTSTSSAQLANAKVEVQNNLRDTMLTLSRELREGVTELTTKKTGAPEDLYAIKLDGDGKVLTFQTPVAGEGDILYTYSTPITFSLQNEDLNGNGKLDDGEDANGDGVLTRRVVRTQDELTESVASANTIDNVQFALVQNQAAGKNYVSTVQISLSGSKRYGDGEGKLVRSEMNSSIRLVN